MALGKANPPPGTIGPYRIVEQIGAGAMGEVYRGYDHRLDRPLALKHIRAKTAGYKRNRKRFRREARAVARLSHPAIVQVHDWIETQEGIWLVMELVEGHSLRQLLEDGPFSPTRCLLIARRIVEGLAVAHAIGLVHRDLKPENVMVQTDDQVKILDFGLAKHLMADTETSISMEGRLVGTVAAMSPEQAVGEAVDHRSDLFSLGTLLYELLTGVSPFYTEHTVKTLIRICNMRPKSVAELNSEIPASLSEVIDQLLTKDPDHRPQSDVEVLTMLDAVALELGLKVEPTSAPLAPPVAMTESGSELVDVRTATHAQSTAEVPETATPPLRDASPQITFGQPLQKARTVALEDQGRSLLDLALAQQISIYHECGGRARCSTCRIRVDSGLDNLRPRTPKEEALAKRLGWGDDIRLACQTRVIGDVEVTPLIRDTLDLGLLLEEQTQATPAREMTLALLSCSLLDFDEFAAQTTPEVGIHLLYRFFGQLGSRVAANAGRIEHYEGARFRALFGLEAGSAADSCLAAVRAAVRCAERMRVFNRYARTYFSREFKIGIGLHRARVAVGRFGTTSLHQLLTLGEACPTVDAIREHNRSTGTKILASPELIKPIESQLSLGQRSAVSLLPGKPATALAEVLDVRPSDAAFLLRRAFERLEGESEQASELFHRQLAEIEPATRALFADRDPAARGSMFIQLLTALLDSFEQSQVEPSLQLVIDHYRKHGVEAQHYEPIGRALLATVEKLLGAELDLDVHLAWDRLCRQLSSLMAH